MSIAPTVPPQCPALIVIMHSLFAHHKRILGAPSFVSSPHPGPYAWPPQALRPTQLAKLQCKSVNRMLLRHSRRGRQGRSLLAVAAARGWRLLLLLLLAFLPRPVHHHWQPTGQCSLYTARINVGGTGWGQQVSCYELSGSAWQTCPGAATSHQAATQAPS